MFSSSAGSDGILSEATWLLNSGLLPNSSSATKAIGYRQVHPGHCHIISFFIFEYCVMNGFILYF